MVTFTDKKKKLKYCYTVNGWHSPYSFKMPNGAKALGIHKYSCRCHCTSPHDCKDARYEWQPPGYGTWKDKNGKVRQLTTWDLVDPQSEYQKENRNLKVPEEKCKKV